MTHESRRTAGQTFRFASISSRRLKAVMMFITTSGRVVVCVTGVLWEYRPRELQVRLAPLA